MALSLSLFKHPANAATCCAIAAKVDKSSHDIASICDPQGNRLWRIKSEYTRLLAVVLRTCTVAVKDLRDVEHSIEITAETLYEAIARALAALQ